MFARNQQHYTRKQQQANASSSSASAQRKRSTANSNSYRLQSSATLDSNCFIICFTHTPHDTAAAIATRCEPLRYSSRCSSRTRALLRIITCDHLLQSLTLNIHLLSYLYTLTSLLRPSPPPKPQSQQPSSPGFLIASHHTSLRLTPHLPSLSRIAGGRRVDHSHCSLIDSIQGTSFPVNLHSSAHALLRYMRHFYTFTLVFAAIYLALAPAAIRRLEAATRQQCATQDWPVHQHQAHVDFCIMEGYPVGPR